MIDMKKLLLPLLAFAFLLSGCEKEPEVIRYYVQTEPDVINYYNGAEIYTSYYTVHDYEWMNGEDFFYVNCENPDITSTVMRNGVVIACVALGEKWYDMPYVYPMPTQAGTIVPENVRFEYGEGMVTIVLQDMDGYLPDPVVGDMTFKVTVIRP